MVEKGGVLGRDSSENHAGCCSTRRWLSRSEKPMTTTNAAPQERTDLEPRTVRALTDYLLVVEDAPGLYRVYGEGGNEYTVDVETGPCTCPDAEYRDPDSGCKHARRVAFHTGARAVPAWVDRDAVDPLLVEELPDESGNENEPEPVRP